MSTSAPESSKISKKPGIPRPSGVRHSLGQLSVSKAIADVLGNNKENAKESRRSPPTAFPAAKVTNKGAAKESSPTDSNKLKSPIVASKATQSAKAESSTPSPPSARKPSSLAVSNGTVSAIKPRDNLATSLPKYKPKASSLLPSKQPPITRKRRNSLVEAPDEEPIVLEASKRIAERPISPLPRRSRVQSTVSASSRIFDPKITLTQMQRSPDKLKTPVKPKGTMSTPSSVRVRTLSTATTSSRISTKNDSPTKRTEKRPRLSSDLLASTSTMAADMSSDSIDIADVSALLAVSPGVSPAKSIAPPSARRITVRRLPLSSSNPSTPSRKITSSAAPARPNQSYLSPNPPKGSSSSLRRPPGREPGIGERGSVLSWADFSNKKFPEEDINLIAEIVPLKGIITPGSDDFHARERADSGWGMDSPRVFTGLSPAPSIGQLMFPSVRSKPDHPPDGEVVAAKLLSVQLSAAEREVSELQAKVRAYESQGNAEGSTPMVTVVTDTDMANELELRTLQNAELEAKAAFLEESLHSLRKAMSEKDGQLAQSLLDVTRLEKQCEVEREEKEEGLQAAQRLVDDSALEVERRVSAVLVDKVAEATEAESHKWKWRLDYLERAEEASREWRSVQSSAQADLAVVRNMQATLRVLMAGIKALKLTHSEIS